MLSHVQPCGDYPSGLPLELWDSFSGQFEPCSAQTMETGVQLNHGDSVTCYCDKFMGSLDKVWSKIMEQN